MGALTGAKSARVHDLLEDETPEPEVTQLSAEQVVRNLPPETLAKLLALSTAPASVEKPEHSVDR